MRLATKEMPKQEPPANQPQVPPAVVAHPHDESVPPAEPNVVAHSGHSGSRARGISAIRAQSGIEPPPVGPGKDAPDLNIVSASSLESVQPLDYQADGTSKRRQKAGFLMWGAVVLTYVLVVVGVVITLTRYGIWDLTPYIPIEKIGIGPSQRIVEKQPGEKLELENPDPEMVFNKAVHEGTSFLQAKNFSRAVLEYNRALSVHPESPEALRGLAKAFEGLGDREHALSTLNMAESQEAKRNGAHKVVP
jgi:hypothetical protein